MKSSMFVIAASIMLAATVSASENTPAAGHEVVARQGTATVDGLDVDAHVAPMPAENRAGFLDSPKRIDQMLRHMLLRRNLANEAKERGLDKDPVVPREFEQALDLKALAVIDFDCEAFGQAANNGQMLEELNANAKAAEAFRSMAMTLAHRKELKPEKRSPLAPLLEKLKLPRWE